MSSGLTRYFQTALELQGVEACAKAFVEAIDRYAIDVSGGKPLTDEGLIYDEFSAEVSAARGVMIGQLEDLEGESGNEV